MGALISCLKGGREETFEQRQVLTPPGSNDSEIDAYIERVYASLPGNDKSKSTR